MSEHIDHEIMGKTEQKIPHSALYTSATWKWGQLPCAEIVTPEGADGIFRLVNAYLFFYRILNPKKYSLRHMLLHRHTAINVLMKRSGCRQVVEMAAGFSPRGCMMSADPSIHYIEVDLPEVIELKRQQLQKTSEGRAILARPNFELRSGNILSPHLTEGFSAVPTFFINEGIMMYFDRAAQMGIWRNLAEFVKKNGGEYVFDYIPLEDEPQRSALGELLSRMRQRLSGHFKPFAYDERTKQDVANDLLAAGFSQADIHSCEQVAQAWSLPYPGKKTCVTIFHGH